MPCNCSNMKTCTPCPACSGMGGMGNFRSRDDVGSFEFVLKN